MEESFYNAVPSVHNAALDDLNEYILKFGEYRCLEPCAVKGCTESILGGENWRFYMIVPDMQSEEKYALIFRSTHGFYK